MSRGVLYITWPGEGRISNLLDRSIASVFEHHPELPVHFVELPDGSTLLDKSKMYDLSPFEETLFLDADTVVMGRLDFGFEKAKQFGLACCICECPWARRYPGTWGDAIEYNTGVLFFDKSWLREYPSGAEESVGDVFREWLALRNIPSSIKFVAKGGVQEMPCNDQAGFASAIERTWFTPFVLPLNWNFRHRWQKTAFGPIKIWHDYDDVPESIRRWNAEQSKPDAVIQCGRVA
jgi:hypothetical protein